MEKQMNSHRSAAVVLLVAVSMLFAARELRSQEAKTKYPQMAPFEEYLMLDRNAEIALARSAAPESISQDATRLGLGPARLRDCRRRQEWLCVRSGARVDVP